MGTTSVEKNISITSTNKAQAVNGWYAQMIEEAEFNRYGLMAMFILVTCCVGGLACWAMWEHFNIATLALLAACTVIPLSLMLAVSPMRVVIPAVTASTAISIIVTIIYLLV